MTLMRIPYETKINQVARTLGILTFRSESNVGESGE